MIKLNFQTADRVSLFLYPGNFTLLNCKLIFKPLKIRGKIQFKNNCDLTQQNYI